MKLSHRVISGLIALCLSLPAQAATITFASNLSGANESPINASPAKGWTVVVYDDILHMLSIQISFTGLLGTTTAAHIHAASTFVGGNAPVAVTPTTLPGFPTGVHSADYQVEVDLTDPASYTVGFYNNLGGGSAAGAEAALISLMKVGNSYVNVHTSNFLGGEIRGPLAQVPDPATTLGLFGFALGVLGLCREISRPKHLL